MPDDKIMARLDRIEGAINGLITGFADRDDCLEMLGDKMDEMLALMNEPSSDGSGLADTLRQFAVALTRIADGLAAIDQRLAAMELHRA